MTEPRKTPRTEAVWADIPFFDPRLPAHARALEIETQELAEALADMVSAYGVFSCGICETAHRALARHRAKQPPTP